MYQVRKGKKAVYCWNDQQRDDAIQNFEANQAYQYIRYKGLGEMNAEQLWETTIIPDNRTLRQATINDFDIANDVSSMLMGDEVPPRRRVYRGEC